MLPDMVHRSLLDANEEAVERSIERARASGDGLTLFLRGMHRYAGLCEVGPGMPPSTVVVDAIGDLAPVITLGENEDEVRLFLRAACDYLLRHDATAPPEDWFSAGAPEARPSFVPVSSLEEAAAAGDLAKIGRVMALLRDAIMTGEYLGELLIEVAAADPQPGGDLLVHAMAAVKGIQGLDAGDAVPILYRLAEGMARSPVPPAPELRDALPGAFPWRECWLAGLREPGAQPERDWLYLTHAYQAARYVQLRARGLRATLAAGISARFFGGDLEAMLRAPVDSRGVATTAAAETGAAGAGVDPDVLYGGIAASCIEPLRSGNPYPILAANAARWGAHLLGSSGAEEITGLLRARFPELLRADFASGDRGTRG